MDASNNSTAEAGAGPVTQLLARFVVETQRSDIPATAVEAAKDLILDTVGVALAAAPRPIGKTIIAHVAEHVGAPAVATVLGARLKAAPEMAALANGVLANALDFDQGSHIPTHALPAALAVAEQRRVCGRDLIDAVILAYEAGARLTQVIDAGRRRHRGPTHLGWWHVGLVGPIAAALAVARLTGLDTQQTATAIGIASCGSGGFRRNMGTMAKAFHSGNAARLGVEAAALAARGFTGDPEIIEAPLGFLAATCPPQDRDEAAIARLGRPYMLETPLRMKRFPACNPGHPLIDAALELCARPGFDRDEIEAIEADLHIFSLLRPRPWDEESAGFSGAFLIAATLVHGTFTLDQLTEETTRDPRVTGLMDRIRHVPAGKPETLTAFLRGNRTIKIEVLPVRRLAAREAMQAKFRDCASRALAPAAVATVEAQILSLEQQADIATLMTAAGGFG
jgi:2-methylcitrate dehydratase PrpD